MSKIFVFKCLAWKDASLKQFCIENNIQLQWVAYTILPINFIGPLQTTWKVDYVFRDKITEFLGEI